MDLTTWEDMDPHMLVGLLNMELRNNSESLDDLTKTHALPLEGLLQKMVNAGYSYQEGLQQFR